MLDPMSALNDMQRNKIPEEPMSRRDHVFLAILDRALASCINSIDYDPRVLMQSVDELTDFAMEKLNAKR